MSVFCNWSLLTHTVEGVFNSYMKYNTSQCYIGIHITVTVTVLSDISLAEDGILQLLISDPAVDCTPLADKCLYAARLY